MVTTLRTSPPMYVPPAPFVLADVVTCANLVEVAYEQYGQWEAQGRPSHWRDFTWTPKHVGTPVDFTAQYDSIGNNHSMVNSYLYAVSHPAQPEGPMVAPMPSQPKLPATLRNTTPPPARPSP